MSDHILRQLYRGEYCPLEKPFIPDRQYDKMLARRTDLEDRFEAALPEELRREFDEYLHVCGEMDLIEEESAFCEGVRLGVRFMECIGLAENGPGLRAQPGREG